MELNDIPTSSSTQSCHENLPSSVPSSTVYTSEDHIPSPERHPRIYIERDYSRGMKVRFKSDVPPALSQFFDDGLIEMQFKRTIEEINDIFTDAEKCGARSFFETMATVLTFNLISLFKKTYYEKCLDKVNRLIDHKSREVFRSRGLRLVSPAYHGLRVIEVIVIDHEFRGN